MAAARGWISQLLMTNEAEDWVAVGDLETVTAAARCIRELDDYPVTGVVLTV